MCQQCQQTTSCSSCDSCPTRMPKTCGPTCDEFTVLNECGSLMRLEGRYPIYLEAQCVDSRRSTLSFNLVLKEQEDTFNASVGQASFDLTLVRNPNFLVKVFVTTGGATLKYKEGIDFTVLNNQLSFPIAFVGGERVDILYFV